MVVQILYNYSCVFKKCVDLDSCGLLPEVTGGYITYDASTATLNCFYGYLPSNSHNKRECRAESTSWTGETFACIRKCSLAG